MGTNGTILDQPGRDRRQAGTPSQGLHLEVDRSRYHRPAKVSREGAQRPLAPVLMLAYHPDQLPDDQSSERTPPLLPPIGYLRDKGAASERRWPAELGQRHRYRRKTARMSSPSSERFRA